MAINQMTSTLDGIIVSHFVSTDALSAITLFMPVSLLVTAMITFVGIGATVKAAKAMGSRDHEAVDGILSTAFLSIFVVGFFFCIGGFVFSDVITGWLTSDEHLAPQLKPYLTVMLGCALAPMMNQFFNQCVCVDGHPIKVTKAVVMIFVTNIVLDLLLVGWLGMGILGSAVATIAAFIISILYLGSHLFSARSGIHFNKPQFSKWLGPNLQQGLPMLISNVVLTLMFLTINTIVQNRLGHNGMFIMSVCLNVLLIGMMLSNGFGEAILHLGGFLFGQQDFTGVRILVRRCLVSIVALTLSFTVFFFFFPGVLTHIFGAHTPELIAMSNTGVSIFITCLTPICIILMLANLFQMEGRLALSPLLIILIPIMLLSALKLFAGSSDDTLLWYAFPVSSVLILLIAFSITEVIRRKERPAVLQPLLLLPETPECQLFEESLENTVDSFYKGISEVTDKLADFNLDHEVRFHVENCFEELLLNTLQHSGIKDNGHFTDIRFVRTDEKFTFSLKYEGKPFDPTVIPKDKRKAGLKLVFGFGEEIEYKYMYGQNMLYLSWANNRSKQ